MEAATLHLQSTIMLWRHNSRDSSEDEVQKPNTQQTYEKQSFGDLIFFAVQILPSLQTCLHIDTGWNSTILLFVFACTVSAEQPMLVCLVVWELLSFSDAKALGTVFYEVMANALHDTATMKTYCQICCQSQDKHRNFKTGHFGVKCF